MFCVQCGKLIQHYEGRVRVDELLLHAGCAIDYLLSRFPRLRPGS